MTSNDEKLPPNWTVHFSNTRQKQYYFNKTNGQKSWEKPSFDGKITVSNPTKVKFTNIVNDPRVLESVGKKYQAELKSPAQNRLKRLQESLKKEKTTTPKIKTTLTSSPRKLPISIDINSKSKLLRKSPQKLSYDNSPAIVINKTRIPLITRKRKHVERANIQDGIEPLKKINNLVKPKLNVASKLSNLSPKKTAQITSTNKNTYKNILDIGKKQTQPDTKSPAQNRLSRLQQSLVKAPQPPIVKIPLAAKVTDRKEILSVTDENLSNNDASPRKKARRPSVTDDEDDLNDNKQISNNNSLNKNEEEIKEIKPTDLLTIRQPQSIFGGVFQWAKSIYNGTIGSSENTQKETQNNCIKINKESTECGRCPFIVNKDQESMLSSNDKLSGGINDVIMTDDDNSIGSDDSMDWDDVIIPQKQPEEPISSSSRKPTDVLSVEEPSHLDTPLTELLIPKINSISDRLKNIDSSIVNRKKVYVVVDTNIFISNLYGLKELINKINENKNIEPQPIIFLPYVVLKELDKLKTLKDSSVSVLAQRANRYVNEEFKKSNGTIKGQSAKEHNRKLIEIDSGDDEIINCCLQLKENAELVELLSNDVNLQNKAMCSGFKATSLSDLDKQLNLDTTSIAK